MKKLFTLLIIIIGLIPNAYPNGNCFIAKENGKILKQEGKCDIAYSPYSTFKIAISLMGFDSDVLKSPNKPSIELTKEISNIIGWSHPTSYPVMLLWEQVQTPETWMKYSVVWYSQWITKQLGQTKFNEYLKNLHYGNMDGSGTPGKNDGILYSWLGNSLKISPLEQVEFLEKLSKLELPLSKKAQENTIKIIALEDFYNNWKLFGKTGGANEGWFIGWIEKNGRRIIFAQHIENNPALTLKITAGRIAKEIAKDNLIPLILAK